MKKWKTKKFNIFGDIWTIKFIDQVLEDRGTEDPNHWLFGASNNIPKTILISTKTKENKPLSDREILCTIAHECVHAILDSGQYINASSDEPMVEFLGKGILSLIQSKVFEYEKID